MARINLSGRVLHGVPITPLTPCVGATVKVYDLDQGGNGDDLIWQGSTDNTGNFQGLSNDWDDTNTISVPIPFPLPGGPASNTLPVPDILLLKINVEQSVNGTTHSQDFPFIQGAGPVPSSPLVVPWQSPQSTMPIGIVNGVDYFEPILMRNAIIAAVDSGALSVSIQFHGPDAQIILNLLNQNQNQIRAFVQQQVGSSIGLPANFWQGMTPIEFWILLGFAGLVLSAGFAVAITVIGISIALAILYAVHKGYGVSANTCNSLFGGQLAAICGEVILTAPVQPVVVGRRGRG